MNEPRLLAKGTAEERRLLSSALSDTPSRRTHNQVLAALGLGIGTLATTTVSEAALASDAAAAEPLGPSLSNALTNGSVVSSSLSPSALPLSTLMTWIGVAGLAVGIGVGTGIAAKHISRTAQPRQGTTVIVVPQAKPVLPTVETVAREGSANESLAQAAATLPLPPPRAPGARTASPIETTPGDALALEVRLMDGARKAIQTGNASLCLEKLDERKRRVGKGMLSPEATLLRIQALLMLHDEAAASREAKSYLKQRPEGPIAERIHAALAKAGIDNRTR